MNFLDTHRATRLQHVGERIDISPGVSHDSVAARHGHGRGGGHQQCDRSAASGNFAKIPVQPLERLYPLIWVGFWVNAVTGTALLMASATKRMVDPTFYIKMVFIFAGVAVLQRTRKQGVPEAGAGR